MTEIALSILFNQDKFNKFIQEFLQLNTLLGLEVGSSIRFPIKNDLGEVYKCYENGNCRYIVRKNIVSIIIEDMSNLEELHVPNCRIYIENSRIKKIIVHKVYDNQTPLIWNVGLRTSTWIDCVVSDSEVVGSNEKVTIDKLIIKSPIEFVSSLISVNEIWLRNGSTVSISKLEAEWLGLGKYLKKLHRITFKCTERPLIKALAKHRSYKYKVYDLDSTGKVKILC